MTAYQAFLDAMAAALEQDGDVDLADVATDQALAAAQARVVGLSTQGRIARGVLVADVQDLAVDGDLATLDDCFVNELVEFDRDTDEELADHAGTRFAAEVTVERRDGAWIVTEFREGDFCVPADLASQVSARYLEFWSAVAAAGRPPDPGHPRLAEVAAGDQLSGLQDRLASFRDDGLEVRGDHRSHPIVVRVSRDDTVAIVTDCRELDPEGGIYDSSTGERVRGGAEPGERSLWEARLELVGGSWKVVDADLLEEGSACDPAS